MTEIKKLVQAMHDSVCQCGEWCHGAEGDFQQLWWWVEDYWGSTAPLEEYLKGLRDAHSTS